MDIDKRIITLIEILGLSPGEFADKISVQRSSISHITSARNKPSLDFLERTLSVFPEINSDWLILGKGKPIKSKEEETIIINSTNIKEIEQPSLFSDTEDYINNKLDEKNDMRNGSVSIKNNELAQNILSSQLNNSELAKKSRMDGKKKISRILFFYEDGTFEVYEN